MSTKIENGADRHVEQRQQLEELRNRSGWSNARIGKELGISRAAVSQLISGKYATRSQEHIWKKVSQLFETISVESEIMPLASHVSTPTSRRIEEALEWAHSQGDIALVYGLAGSGKTWTAVRYADAHSGVIYVCATPACSTVYSLLRLLARTLGVKALEGSTAVRLESAVLDAMKGSTARLLVIDEAHHLPQEVIDEARCLYDAAGARSSNSTFGMALLGNDPLRSTLLAAARCAQIVSRIGRTVPIKTLSTEDVKCFARLIASDQPDKKFLTACREIASRPGALRRLVKVGRDATALAVGEGRETVAANDLKLAEQVRVG